MVTECSLVLKWDMEQVLREMPAWSRRSSQAGGESLPHRWRLKVQGCKRSPRVRMERDEGTARTQPSWPLVLEPPSLSK